MMTTPETRRRLEAAGLMIFEDPDRVIAAISRLAGFHEGFRRPAARPIAIPCAITRLPAQLSESAAKALLGAAGVAFAPEVVAWSAAEAVAAARDFGRPVALKIAADGIAHKSDIGGVLLNVCGDVAVAEGFAAVRSNVLKARPDARIEGALVAPMILGGVETVIGVHNDPDFGPVAMFGLGGVYVEALKDVAFRLAPVSQEDALDMIREIRGFPALAGARGRRPVDLNAIACAIVALSRFAAAHRDDIETIDVNPFIALPEGGVAVDALIVVRNRPVSNKAASND
jgi:acyl-CoA synthetase (NDP forming)